MTSGEISAMTREQLLSDDFKKALEAIGRNADLHAELVSAGYSRAEQLGCVEEMNALLMPNEESSGPIHLMTVADVEKKPVRWLVPHLIPRETITLLAGDGGVGKSTLWACIAAAVSTGKTPAISPVPFGGEPEEVIFFSSEDSVAYTLRDRLEKAGADLNRIRFLDVGSKDINRISFDSPELERAVNIIRPGLMIFDPLQGFLPPDVNMSSRSAMRHALLPLVQLGEKYGVASLIVVHSNKRGDAWGRNRIADSADLWDFSRSVLIVGETADDGIRYLSCEKLNYAARPDTVLFQIVDGQIQVLGTTQKRDRDYVLERATVKREERAAPARDEAKETILRLLSDGSEFPAKELEEKVLAAGVSFAAFKRAKTELNSEKKILFFSKSGAYFYRLNPEAA